MLKAKSHNSNIIKCEDKPIKRKFGIQEIGNQIQKRKGGDCPEWNNVPGDKGARDLDKQTRLSKKAMRSVASWGKKNMKLISIPIYVIIFK